MIELREFSLENVWSALLHELPHAERDELRERAQGFIAIADQSRVPIEELLQWIHADASEKEYSLREWRAYCAQRPVPKQEPLFCSDYEPEPPPDAFDPRPRR